ncbi:hypothetical protein H7K45_09715 [Mycobacterium yunnanensis]|uniref:Uncharacterized protein n=1 Tax=Mycobacterium yunnanensis TaxID=368477 RepID=A0A9X2YYR8_9MYCO|nr:hypothetical protein [Mycobacterium yunnanensis]MCV7420813.1 hypothetical protein [Mycobacterium yunnanensis]
MSVVVERGLARCPRCVAVADYTFVESGPNTLCYEVQCGKCGEAYREVHTPVAPAFAATADALVVLPPPARPTALQLFERRVVAWLQSVRAKIASVRHGRGPSPVVQEGASSERV